VKTNKFAIKKTTANIRLSVIKSRIKNNYRSGFEIETLKDRVLVPSIGSVLGAC
jgi:hypothetical protein